MSKILTNETNLDSLKKAISNAKKRIYIISPWITSETFKKVFTEEIVKRLITKKIKVNIVIRLSSMEDIKYTDEEFFRYVDSFKNVFLIKYNKNLHSKLYIVDDFYASVGSYNLTGGGFGDEENKGTNIETGYELKDKKEIKAIIEIAEKIWEESTEIADDLLGFTLNETTHHSFVIAGIRPLENGKFVEIRENGNEIVLGQIGEVRKYNFSFFNEPTLEENNESLISTFSNFSELANKIKGIISANSLEYGQLNVGNVNIIGRFFIKNKEIIREDNKIAPDVAKEVYIASSEILKALFSNRYCSPAVLYSNREVEAGIDPDEIITKHMAVFGTTGSGKSYFVKKMIDKYLYEYFVKSKKARIIIFDPHGEYKKDLKKLSSKNVIDYQECIKRKYLTYYIADEDDFCEYFKIRKNTKVAGAIADIFSYNVVSNKNIKELLEEKGINGDFIKYLEDAIKNNEISFDEPDEIWKDFKKPDIYCISFDEIGELEDMWTITGNIVSSVFNHAKSSKNFPTLFVIEEAHNFVPEGEGKNNYSAKAIRQIAREGRKFQVGMIVITQRPAYVSKDILSQCSTQAIFRLINSNDISQVADVVEGIGKEELIRLPHYTQGQCIFTGVGIESPVVVKINM